MRFCMKVSSLARNVFGKNFLQINPKFHLVPSYEVLLELDRID